MLSIIGKPQQACDGFTRREMIRVGGLTALGLTCPSLLSRARAGGAVAESSGIGFGRAKACVVVYLFGGPSQIDTWDMKPDAPVQFRGEFQPIATRFRPCDFSRTIWIQSRVAISAAPA